MGLKLGKLLAILAIVASAKALELTAFVVDEVEDTNEVAEAVAPGSVTTKDLLVLAHSTETGFKLSGVAPEGVNLQEILSSVLFKAGVGSTELVPLVDNEKYGRILVAGLGSEEPEDDGVEPKKDALRQAMAFGMRALRASGATDVDIDCGGDPYTAGEGVGLGLYVFDRFHASKTPILDYRCVEEADAGKFKSGLSSAENQNLVRSMGETPANEMWPESFVEWAVKEVEGLEGVTTTVHNNEWMLKNGFGALMSVVQGSVKEGQFLIVEYLNGVPADTPAAIMVGKGITFDSGGLSLKTSEGMEQMRGDMQGAANVVAVIRGLAKKKVKGHYYALACMAENMPSGSAARVSDVVTAYNNVTIEIVNTDAEGRMVMADGLSYATAHLNPRMLMSVATLTGSVRTALDFHAAGAFTKSATLFSEIQAAGHKVGERFWELPSYDEYDKSVRGTNSHVKNSGATSIAGASTAAGFLRYFVNTTEYIHLDIAGINFHRSTLAGSPSGVTGPGFSGRPVRGIIEFMKGLKWD